MATFGIALALAGVAGGCGGGGSDSGDKGGGATVTTGSLSKAEFVKQGDAICKKAGAGLLADTREYMEKNGLDAEHEPSEAQQGELITQVLAPQIQTELDGIAALGAPAGEADEVQEFLDAAEAALAKVEADPGVIVEGPDPFEDANEKEQDLGFTVCGESP
jgi:hypothetical protein